MLFKQKRNPGEPEAEQKSKITDDPALKSASNKAKDVLAKLDEQAKRRKGHFESCCGVKFWVED